MGYCWYLMHYCDYIWCKAHSLCLSSHSCSLIGHILWWLFRHMDHPLWWLFQHIDIPILHWISMMAGWDKVVENWVPHPLTGCSHYITALSFVNRISQLASHNFLNPMIEWFFNDGKTCLLIMSCSTPSGNSYLAIVASPLLFMQPPPGWVAYMRLWCCRMSTS